MSVPRAARQRNESTSSTGSWQMVSTTGSYKTGDSYMVTHAGSMAAAAAANDANREAAAADGTGVVVFEDDPMYEILLQ